MDEYYASAVPSEDIVFFCGETVYTYQKKTEEDSAEALT